MDWYSGRLVVEIVDLGSHISLEDSGVVVWKGQGGSWIVDIVVVLAVAEDQGLHRYGVGKEVVAKRPTYFEMLG